MAADKSPERIALEARAEDLGIRFAWNTGDDTLAERIADAEAKVAAASGEAIEAAASQTAATSHRAILRVTGPKTGRWRAGRHFTSEPVDIPVTDLTKAERVWLEADDRLTVVLVVPGGD